MAKGNLPSFVMFSTEHIMAVIVLVIFAVLLIITKKRLVNEDRNVEVIERVFASSLLIMEISYHGWMITTARWDAMDSLPLELCSLSLLVAIVLLWTGNKNLYPFVFFAGIGGALQALATPVLDVGFPHFRYFHFFYTHIGIILTALYFTWVKGYRPTFKGIIKTLIALNLLLPLIFMVNEIVEGNYLFLRMKPTNGSLLDLLGPYPWYILSLEGVAFIMFFCLWLAFRKWTPTTKV